MIGRDQRSCDDRSPYNSELITVIDATNNISADRDVLEFSSYTVSKFVGVTRELLQKSACRWLPSANLLLTSSCHEVHSNTST